MPSWFCRMFKIFNSLSQHIFELKYININKTTKHKEKKLTRLSSTNKISPLDRGCWLGPWASRRFNGQYNTFLASSYPLISTIYSSWAISFKSSFGYVSYQEGGIVGAIFPLFTVEGRVQRGSTNALWLHSRKSWDGQDYGPYYMYIWVILRHLRWTWSPKMYVVSLT